MTEVTTVVTDYLLSGLAFVLGSRLARANTGNDSATRLWVGALRAAGLASLAGGTWHGLEASLGPVAGAVLWRLTMVAVGASGLFLLGATIAGAGPPGAVRSWRLALVGVWVAYAGWVCLIDSGFVWAIMVYGAAMAVALVLQVGRAMRGAQGSRTIIAGLLLSFLGAGIQQSGLSLSASFNHNDLYHVVKMVAIYLFYKGALPAADVSYDRAQL